MYGNAGFCVNRVGFIKKNKLVLDINVSVILMCIGLKLDLTFSVVSSEVICLTVDTCLKLLLNR